MFPCLRFGLVWIVTSSPASSILGAFAALCLLSVAMPADAQLFSGRHAFGGGYGGGDYGAYPYSVPSGYSNTSRMVMQADRSSGQRAMAAQSAAMQQGIRSTLSSQADARTQAIYSQRQQGRDWWFQTQQQQMAQRQSMGSRPGMSAAMANFEPEPAALSSRAATDVIKWPVVLQDERFAEQRAMIEAPYRRVPKANPTLTDYRDMVEGTEQMKAFLKQMLAEISAQEYLSAESFLNQLAGEARGRIEKAAPAEKK